MSRARDSAGKYGISSPGVSQRVDTSAPNLGMALSKAQTLATGIQRELKAAPDEEDVVIRVALMGGEALGGLHVGRVIVRRHVIETWVP